MTGRLIVNVRSETAKVITQAHAAGVATVQVSALADRVTELGAMTTVEVTFGKHEITALCLQLADSIGMACELTPSKQPDTRSMRVTGAEYVLKSITPKDDGR